MNSLFQQLNQATADNWATMFKRSRNPGELLMGLANRNPQVSAVMRDVQANGGDAKGLFLKRAQEMGIDPNLILGMLR